MEATINVKVSLEEATLQRLGQIMTACVGGARPAMPPKPEPVQIRAEAPKPEAPAEPAKAEVSVVQLNGAVVNAMGRGVSQDTLKALLAQEGLSKFSECPADKRSALLDKVNAL